MKVNRIFYPGSRVKMLVSPIPYRGINHRVANNYITHHASKNPLILPVLYGIPDDIKYTISNLETGEFYGLKMFRGYFSPPSGKITEYFPIQVLKYCEKVDIPIILHLPSNVIASRKELITIAEKFPQLKIILAHMGLAYLPLKGLKKTFILLSKHQNIFLDTWMVTFTKIFKTAIDIFGYHRIIFGTDQPFNLIRGEMYKDPIFGIKIATEYPYHWIDLKRMTNFRDMRKIPCSFIGEWYLP
jgi:predicted TIM-barrel fold metal-dependent hydrolase